MNKNIENILACPKCKSDLKKIGKRLNCRKCRKNYGFDGEIPVFLEKIAESEEMAAESFKSKLRGRPGLVRLRNVFGPPSSAHFARERAKEMIMRKGLVLNIGSSSKRAYPNTVNLDIGRFGKVDVIGDGKKLPFKNGVFDAVLIESVLEHIDEPEKVITESYRVLKKGGAIYISIPFVYAFHGSPNDYNRYTLNGLRERLRLNKFRDIRSGILCGAGSTISQMLRYYLALIFSFNSAFLFSLFLNIFGWLTFPLKYTDILLNRYRKSALIASSVWALARK